MEQKFWLKIGCSNQKRSQQGHLNGQMGRWKTTAILANTSNFDNEFAHFQSNGHFFKK